MIAGSALSNIKWVGILKSIQTPTDLITGILLARFLSPLEFGLMGMAMVFIGFANIFVNFGFGRALVQIDQINQNTKSSVFWFNGFVGILLFALFLSLAPLIAMFFKTPDLTTLIRVISLLFLIRPLSVTHEALMTREMRFKQMTIVKSSAKLSSSLLGVAMAVSGYGVWSLVARSFWNTISLNIGLWVTSGWLPRLSFSRMEFNRTWKYGKGLTGYTVTNYFIRNSDNLLIGKFLGGEALGQYSRAYQLLVAPAREISSVFVGALFPNLSRLQNDLPSFRKLYITISKSIALVTFPLYICLYFLADLFVIYILGEQWSSIIPIVKVFSILGAFHSVGSTVGLIYTSLGQTTLLFKWGLYSGIITVLSFSIGVYLGTPLAVAVVFTTANLTLVLVPSFLIPFSLIHLGFMTYLGKLSKIGLSALVMILACILIEIISKNGMINNDFYYFILIIATPFVAYVPMLLVSKEPLFINALILVRNKFTK